MPCKDSEERFEHNREIFADSEGVSIDTVNTTTDINTLNNTDLNTDNTCDKYRVLV